MHYAIIAAGEGSRLAEEGIVVPKPLVEVNGEKLIDRLIRIFEQNNPQSISIILNSQKPQLIEYVSSIKTTTKIDIINKTTPSSMHSFYELSHYLKGKFCLTTIDTIFKEEEFSQFIKNFEKDEIYGGMMAVTDYIDDEKPLYVATDNNMQITGFYDTHQPQIKYISGGIYALTPPALDILKECVEQGVNRMRNYQRVLIEKGMKLQAVPFGKVIDIDHAVDIVTAEKFLNER